MTIVLWNLNRFQNLFTAGKCVKFNIAHLTYFLLPHTSRKLNLILMHLCILNCVNFMTFQLIKISRTILWVCSLQCIVLTQNQIINQVIVFFSAGTSSSAATFESVDRADVSELYPQPAIASFRPLCLFGYSFVSSIALYPFNWYKLSIKILSLWLNTMFTNTAMT